MPLFEVVGSAGTVLPVQIVMAVPKLNAGTAFGFTVTVYATGMAQTPAAGVKV